MTGIGKVDDTYDPHAVERRVSDYWDAVDAYERTREHRAGGEPYFFVDGPPYTSGAAHLGTTWNKALKDAYLRYLRMRGYDVADRPGYDMHGLPIETKVEEKLGFENKKDIEAFGEDAFIAECKRFAEENLEGMREDFISFGVWMDWDNPYKTVDPAYMEAAWWGFAQAHERGLVEQGLRSITQCPRCETAIAKNEVEYEDIEDPSIYVTFDLIDREGELVIWTTTPWTIPANAFVAVDPELTYHGVKVIDGEESRVLYVAASCVEHVLEVAGFDDGEVVDEVTGEEMVGWSYRHPLTDEVPEHPRHDGSQSVYAADYVEADRTGLVHSAPGHGEEDFERGHELGFPIVCPVGENGVFDERAGAYAGQFVKDADAAIIADLDANGALIAEETIIHSYGHCWRCDTGIVQIVTDQWFITVTDIKDDLLANIEESDWYPSWARDNRFRDFVEEAPDWNVSRQRYWGIPLPIWTPEGAEGDDDMIVIATREALAERVDQDIDPTTVDLHKDTVDDLTITEDGTTYTRVPDVFDVWLDSSVASWGTLGFPENREAFDTLWPADLIIEAHDQTRGWFWSQLGMGTAALGEIPYRQVLMHGHALDEDGRKMSKSVGNIVEPSEAIERHGADAMRLFLLSATPQGDDMRFSWAGMREMENRLRTLWNVFRFPLPYMDLDGYAPGDADPADADIELNQIDRWILSRLQTTTAKMTHELREFRQDHAIDALFSFLVDDVSRYYIQQIRERMWDEQDSPSKRAAYATMDRILLDVSTLLAPFAPFVAEEMYRVLRADDDRPTVHMADWPTPVDHWIDEELEADIEILRALEEAGATARQQAGRKLRWPVARVVVATEDDAVARALDRHDSILRERLNARSIEVVAGGDGWGELRYAAEADMSRLGPAFGSRAGDVMTALNEARIEDPTLDELERAVSEQLGESIHLAEEMVSFVAVTPDDVAGVAFEVDGDERGIVYVDVTLTDELESEGYARELVRRVQEMRKELDLEIEEPIRVEYTIDDHRVAELVAQHEDFIAAEVRAETFGAIDDGLRQTWEVEATEIEIAIAPVVGARAS